MKRTEHLMKAWDALGQCIAQLHAAGESIIADNTDWPELQALEIRVLDLIDAEKKVA
jgi:hypothetical protein